MQKRKATRDFDYTQGVDVGFIINVLLEEFNANYNDKRTNEVRFSEPVSMEIKMKDTYFDVFDEIAENTESYWDIVDGKVIFAKEIGVHKPQTIIYEGSSDNP
ncbi:MAG: hypothetical protein LBG59_07965 [Candidatus Peribacteria bacterium]|jgi:hypothetical protein|nr:hypothetical protein [Candidatus Peribacteria bacterium]